MQFLPWFQPFRFFGRIALLFFFVLTGGACNCVDNGRLTFYACNSDGTCNDGRTCCDDQKCRLDCSTNAPPAEIDAGLDLDAGSNPDVVCSATTCPTGCCDGNTCVTSPSGMACGARGVACTTCPTGESCVAGSCSGCSANCPTGCCAGSICTPASLTSCGLSGAACVSCGVTADTCNSKGDCACGQNAACLPGQRCQQGQCLCDATSCATGCCTSNGLCVSGSDQNQSLCGSGGQQCAGCTAPPPAFCASPATRTAYASPGQCQLGSCKYTPSDMTCAGGCVDGNCIGDKCQGCLTPLPPECIGNILKTHTGPGACVMNACNYMSTEVTCAFGCSAGACLPDPCKNVSCNAPPAPTCNGSTLKRPAAIGTCINGTCNYPPTEENCVNGCASGACIACVASSACVGNAGAPCRAGVTACPGGDNSTAVCVDGPNTSNSCAPASTPAPLCATGNTLRTYKNIGSCSAGTCQNAFTDMVCNMPPPTECAAARRIREFNAAGTCGNGRCNYEPVEYDCPNAGLCSNGACEATCRQTCTNGCNVNCPSQCANEDCF